MEQAYISVKTVGLSLQEYKLYISGNTKNFRQGVHVVKIKFRRLESRTYRDPRAVRSPCFGNMSCFTGQMVLSYWASQERIASSNCMKQLSQLIFEAPVRFPVPQLHFSLIMWGCAESLILLKKRIIKRKGRAGRGFSSSEPATQHCRHQIPTQSPAFVAPVSPCPIPAPFLQQRSTVDEHTHNRHRLGHSEGSENHRSGIEQAWGVSTHSHEVQAGSQR